MKDKITCKSIKCATCGSNEFYVYINEVSKGIEMQCVECFSRKGESTHTEIERQRNLQENK